MDALIVLDQVSEPDCGVVDRPGPRPDRGAGPAATRPSSSWPTAGSRSAQFRNVCVKPNERGGGRLPRRGRPRSPRSYGRHVFQTLGEHGIDLFAPTGPVHVPAYPVTGPTDIVGAGDSTSAGIACAVMAGATLRAGGGVRQPGGVDHHSADRRDRDGDAGPGPRAVAGRSSPAAEPLLRTAGGDRRAAFAAPAHGHTASSGRRRHGRPQTAAGPRAAGRLPYNALHGRPAPPTGWFNRTVIGAGLTSLLADVAYEMATAVMPGFFRFSKSRATSSA